MALDPILRVETLEAPADYSRRQIERAFKVAAMLAMISPDERGRFLLAEKPQR